MRLFNCKRKLNLTKIIVIVCVLSLLLGIAIPATSNLVNKANAPVATANTIERMDVPIAFGGNSISEDVSGLAFRFDVEVSGMTTKGTTAIYDNATLNGHRLVSMGAIVTNGKSTIDITAKNLCYFNETTASFAVRIIDIPTDKYDIDITATPYVILEIDDAPVTLYSDEQTRTYNNILNPEPDKNIIPEGGVYTVSDGAIYQSGDEFPEEAQNGDSYVFGDYKYVYRINDNGWQVYVLDKKQSQYGVILSEIVDEPVNSLYYTFESCTNMVTAPRIPSSIEYMSYAFSCCTSLSGIIYVDANPSSYRNCFYGVNIEKQGISIEGDASFTTKNELLLSKKTSPSLTSGSKYVCGDYTYTFNSTGKNWWVKVNNTTQTEYGEILHHIYTYPVVRLDETFRGCSYMKKAPVLPYTATSMYGTFIDCVLLEDAPEIPENVTTLEHAFYYCRSLKVAPKIPSKVVNMCNTFRDCSSLLVAPEIPDSVSHMNGTFHSCSSMTTAPVIQNTVRYYKDLFRQCKSLTGTIEINTTSYNYENCFFNVDFQTQHLNLTGTSPILDRIASSALGYCKTCKGYCYE